MAKKDELTRDSLIKVINNTTGSLSFVGVDDRKYLMQRPNAYKMIPLSVIEGLYNESENFIRDGYIIFEDIKIYDYLGVDRADYGKLISIKEIDKLLEKNAEEIKEVLEDAPDVIKENVAVKAKEKGIDSKKKIKAIKESTGFDIEDNDDELEG